MMPKVRDAIRVVEDDGWIYQRTRGDHRIYKHPVKPGIVIIAGHPRDDIPIGTWQSIQQQAGLRSTKEH
jgi:predicted RNA binding protein YcfA (HicA-like mRNA interferase family)